MLDIFINYDGDIDDIADKISELLGVELLKEFDEALEVQRYKFMFLDIEFVLFDNHELEDDCGINFSEYNYALAMIKLRSGEKIKSYNEMYNNMAVFLTEKLSLAFSSNVMLVDNLQRIVLSNILV